MTIYSNNIPQPSDRPSDSQDDLLQNFQALKVFLDRNHVAIIDPTTNTSEGKHKFLQMPEQAADPATAVNEGGLYVKETNSRATLYWRNENNGNAVQLTRGVPTKSATGETYLPGGIILKWGIGTFPNSNQVTINYGGTAYASIYQVVATLSTANSFADREKFNISDVGTTSFKAWVKNSTNANVRWFAIGV